MLFRRSPSHAPAPRLADGEVVELDGCAVRLRVSARARRISLRLDPARREVVATAPRAHDLPAALAFARSRAGWVKGRLAELPAPLPLTPGAVIPLGGEPCRLERAAMRIRSSIRPASGGEGPRLIASGEGEAYARAAVRALKAEALARLEARTAHHCARLGLPPAPVALQDARTRWGSCRGAGGGRPAAIRYNWRLVLAPPEVLDYVAAHECAHLQEANHGPRFWALVRRLYGDPAAAQAWLKREGARLHAVG